MDTISNSILNFLNMLFTEPMLTKFGSLNEILAYILTLGLVYTFILKPVIKLFNRK